MKLVLPKTPFLMAIYELFDIISTEIIGERPFQVNAYLAGGAAVHLYNSSRTSNDVDTVFSPPVHINDVVVHYTDEKQRKRTLVYDPTYFAELGLIHPDYQNDSRQVWRKKNLTLHVLSPVDIAVTKIARFLPRDKEDIAELAAKGFLTPELLEKRANEAIDYFIGNTAMLKYNIQDACDLVRQNLKKQG